MTTIFAEILINAKVDEVYQSYAKIQDWKRILSDVLDVSTIKEDDDMQDFYMTVMKNFNVETVHSVRYLEKNKSIQLWQPVPPPQVSRMEGMWKFEALNDKVTRVRAIRSFDMLNTSDLIDYKRRLQTSLEKNLRGFKNYNEKIGVIEVADIIPAERVTVSEKFWDINSWRSIWPKIQDVDLTFDNHFLQEFLMKVNRNQRLEFIRVIQERKSNGDISFYNTSVPPKLSIHHGEWNFQKLGAQTGVISRRVFKMDSAHNKEFSEYKWELQNRLRSILKAFRQYFEHVGGIE